MTTIRAFNERDWPQVWAIIKPVFRAGATYPFSPDITESESRKAWIDAPTATYVCEDGDQNIIGSYYIKSNQPYLGAHVCNCGYIVEQNARGKGLASAMCQHSQQQAVQLGFRSMQFNLVVTTNKTAVKLWQKHNFRVVGVLPEAFNHKEHGYVDALVMYKQLTT